MKVLVTLMSADMHQHVELLHSAGACARVTTIDDMYLERSRCSMLLDTEVPEMC